MATRQSAEVKDIKFVIKEFGTLTDVVCQQDSAPTNYVPTKIPWKEIDILTLSCNKTEKDVNYMNNALPGTSNKAGHDGSPELI